MVVKLFTKWRPGLSDRLKAIEPSVDVEEKHPTNGDAAVAA
jgi:hypothetical protein